MRINEKIKPPLQKAWYVHTSISAKGVFLSVLSFFRFSLFQIFCHTKLHNPADQIVGHGLIERKLDRPFALLVCGKFFLKRRDSTRHRIKSDMILECRKMHQILRQYKSRHLVLDGFFGLG